MKNKVIKILVLNVLIIILIFAFSQVVHAWDPDWNGIDNYSAGNTTNAIYSIAGSIISILKVVAAGVAIIMLIVIGIQYMLKSPEGKALYKETATPYVIGAIIAFSASALVQVIQMLASGISSSV